MELTILLSKVFGIYLIIGGLAYTMRQRYFMSVVRDFVEHKMLRYIIAISELVAGLFLIMTHNVWESWPEGIVSLVGWMLAVEGAFYMLAPDSWVRKMLRIFNKRGWYLAGGIISLLLGLYLVNFGFDIL